MDNIYIKYNLTLTDLLRAVRHYTLDADDEVKTLRVTQNSARSLKMKGLNDMLKLSPEHEQRITDGVNQAGSIGEPAEDGTMKFDSFQKLYAIL